MKPMEWLYLGLIVGEISGIWAIAAKLWLM